MVKINHELPVKLLNKFDGYNDIDFCLPVFYKNIPKYRDHFLENRNKGRLSIMDNGLFEGKIPPETELFEMLLDLNPSLFVVPDAWDNPIETYENAARWMDNKSIFNTTYFMVVMQGQYYDEVASLYEKCTSLGYEHFAINHSSRLYQSFGDSNRLINQMNGRKKLLDNLKSDGLIKDNHYIHLLGCSLPQEGLLYKGKEEYSFISSVDTSNPVINGIIGVRYEDSGLLTKPEEKMENFIISSFTEKQISDVEYNILKFKEMWDDQNQTVTQLPI